ncbi:MAG: hypothetical protein GY754_44225 [bacterium]|nr:hypothetical protein [bacterium]
MNYLTLFKKTNLFYGFIILILLFCSPGALHAVAWTFGIDDAGRHEFVLELDPYYSDVEYIYSITSAPIPKIYLEKEWSAYWYLFTNMYKPRFILLEASAYPLPIAGVYIKKYARDFYDDTEVYSHLNIIKAITEGFPEPYAFSLFLGNVTDYVEGEGEEMEIVGKGFSGLLFSYGNKHIVDNTMVNDHWMETEIKLKGSDIRGKHDLSWSYSLGAKFHFNDEIKDALYLSIKRSRIDFVDEDINFLWKFLTRNSEQEFRIDFHLQEFYKGKVTRYHFLFGKKFPIDDGTVTLSLGFGVIKIMSSGYTGTLEQQINDRWSFMIRPNIHIKLD